jgi:CAAX prenyl protease-like protein
MLLLSAPFEPSAATPPRLSLSVPAQVAVAAALLVTAGVTVELLRPSWAGIGHGLAAGAIHGGLIAIGWLIATAAVPGWRAPVMRLAGAVILASVASHLGQWGPLVFLLVPILLLRETWGVPTMRAMGVCGARPAHLLAGLVAGTFLGMHLLLTASLTFGYRVHTSSPAAYVSAVAYDLGANVLSAEWLFRGALFTACWRLSSFWPAALATTALALVRYLLDPALPAAPEARAGAIFYLGLVGLIACALRAWSGSLLPGYLASFAFFAAYRTLTP